MEYKHKISITYQPIIENDRIEELVTALGHISNNISTSKRDSSLSVIGDWSFPPLVLVFLSSAGAAMFAGFFKEIGKEAFELAIKGVYRVYRKIKNIKVEDYANSIQGTNLSQDGQKDNSFNAPYMSIVIETYRDRKQRWTLVFNFSLELKDSDIEISFDSFYETVNVALTQQEIHKNTTPSSEIIVNEKIYNFRNDKGWVDNYGNKLRVKIKNNI